MLFELFLVRTALIFLRLNWLLQFYPRSLHISLKSILPESCPHVQSPKFCRSSQPRGCLPVLSCLQNSHRLNYLRKDFSTSECKYSQFRKAKGLVSKSQVLLSPKTLLSQKVETKPLVGSKCRQRNWWFILQTSGAAKRKKIIIHRQSLFLIKIGRMVRVINLILLELYWEIKMLMEKNQKKILLCSLGNKVPLTHSSCARSASFNLSYFTRCLIIHWNRGKGNKSSGIQRLR